MAPDVIVPSSNLVTTILQQETRTIPIVFVAVGDPVGSGYVASIAQPGGNITGFANWENTIAGKWVEALNEDRASGQPRRVHPASGDTRHC
jgi:putative ABC transport system substrate-binding protein